MSQKIVTGLPGASAPTSDIEIKMILDTVHLNTSSHLRFRDLPMLPGDRRWLSSLLSDLGRRISKCQILSADLLAPWMPAEPQGVLSHRFKLSVSEIIIVPSVRQAILTQWVEVQLVIVPCAVKTGIRSDTETCLWIKFYFWYNTCRSTK